MNREWTYGGIDGPPPIDLLRQWGETRESRMAIAAREIKDLVASDLLAEDRGRELIDLLEREPPCVDP